MTKLETRAEAWDRFAGESREFTISDAFNAGFESGYELKLRRSRLTEKAFKRGFEMPVRVAEDDCVRDSEDNIVADLSVNADPSWGPDIRHLILQHIADAINAYTPKGLQA